MGTNKKRQDQLRRMFRRQEGRCHWCGVGMVPPGTHKGKGKPDPRLCTVDHLDCRYSEDRGKHAGEYRRVAACWTCNNNRATMQQANMPKEVLWRKSNAYPDERFHRASSAGAAGMEQLAGQRGEPQSDRGAHCSSMPIPPGMYGNGNWGVRCSWCSVMTSDRNKDKAIADWNRKPSSSTCRA